MKIKDLVAVFGSLREIGNQFGISAAAVSQWDGKVPERRQNELRGIYPDIDKRIERAKRRLERQVA